MCPLFHIILFTCTVDKCAYIESNNRSHGFKKKVNWFRAQTPPDTISQYQMKYCLEIQLIWYQNDWTNCRIKKYVKNKTFCQLVLCTTTQYRNGEMLMLWNYYRLT